MIKPAMFVIRLILFLLTVASPLLAAMPHNLWQFVPSQQPANALAEQRFHLPQHSSNQLVLSLNYANIDGIRKYDTLAVPSPLYHAPLQLTVNKVSAASGQTVIHAADEGQRLVLTTDGVHTFATLITARGVWSISGKNDTAIMFQTHDPRHTHQNSAGDYKIAPDLPVKKKPLSRQQEVNTDVNSDQVALVDTYIIYNDAAAQLYGESAVLTRIHHLVAVTNDIYQASNVKIALNALRIDKVDYPQSTANSDALDDATGIGDDTQLLAEQRLIRDAIGADTMVFFRAYRNDGNCGIAWVNSSFNSNRYMVSHTSIDCSDDTTAHELGHNMGLSHSRRQGNTGGTYPFALGYGVDSNFTTVMAYESSFAWATGLYKFSSPDLDCNGLPCGIDRNDVENGADAVYALNQKRFEIAEVAERGPANGSLTVRLSGADQAVISSSSGHGGSAPYAISEVALGELISLTAPATANDVPFAAWTGCDTVTDLTCELTVRGDMSVTLLYSEGVAGFGEIVEAPALSFTTSGSSDWRIDFASAAQGDTSLRSGVISHNQQSSVETTVSGAGTLRFYWKVSSEQNYDHLRLYVNGQRYTEISGSVNWYEASVTLQDGTHQIRWAYEKDQSVDFGEDAGWLDGVSWQTAAGTNMVTVNKAGSGKGTVIRGANETVCDETCEGFVAMVDSASWLYLTASADEQSEFSGWSGACSGQGQSCQLYVTEDISTTALFNAGVAPANDNLAFAAEISGNSGQVSAQSRFASLEQGETQLNSASGKTLWWRWTAPADGEAQFNTFNSDFNTVLVVYQGGTFATLNQLALNDNAGDSLNSQVSFNAQAGQRYLIMVDGMFGGAGDVWLNWDFTANAVLSVNVTGTGTGSVILENNATCTDSCQYSFVPGSVINLQAVADDSSEFTGWAGACSGTGQCQLSLTQSVAVTAEFVLKQYAVTSSASAGGVISQAASYVLHGAPAVFVVAPAKGFKVERKVEGSCPPGVWINETTYQTGPVAGACSVSFSFVKNKRRRVPFWLFATQDN